MAGSQGEDTLLGIYLNDHLAGAVAGCELASRLTAGEGDASALRRLTAEIRADRAALVEMMTALGVPRRQYKQWAAWVAEKAGRLKFNGRLLSRSPLTRVIEFEMMRLAVEGKAAGWRTLRARSARDTRLDTARLDGLIERARGQIDLLERLRVDAATTAFGGDAAAAGHVRDQSPG